MAKSLETRRKALLARREELERLSEIAAGRRETVELDQTKLGRLSRMDALQEQEMALAQERRRKAELQRIEAALKRIEEGEYGYCLACDEPIAEKRLDNDPAAMTQRLYDEVWSQVDYATYGQ